MLIGGQYAYDLWLFDGMDVAGAWHCFHLLHKAALIDGKNEPKGALGNNLLYRNW